MTNLEIPFNGKLISIIFNSKLWEIWGPGAIDSGPYASTREAIESAFYGHNKNSSYKFYGEFDTLENCISHLLGLAKDGKI